MSRLIRLSMLSAVTSVTQICAAVVLPEVYTDHMVLQRDRQQSIRGLAAPGETVEVQYAEQSWRGMADENGRWSIELPPLAVNEGSDLVIQGEDSQVVLKDVAVGDVFLASGQSNMEWTLSNSLGGNEAAQAIAQDSGLRYLKTLGRAVAQPDELMAGAVWQKNSAEAAGRMSGVGMFFAMAHREKTKVPVGMIDSSLGGTYIEAWTPPAGFDAVPELAAWADAARNPLNEEHTTVNVHDPSALFNAMIAPLLPLEIAGVLWYQGEMNLYEQEDYELKLRAWAAGWRAAFGQDDLPLYLVQIAPFMYLENPIWLIREDAYYYRKLADREFLPQPDMLPGLWEAQRKFAASDVNAYLAVINDLGCDTDLHPRNKQPVGERLAVLVQNHTQKDQAVMTFPQVTEVIPAGERVVLRFDQELMSRDGATIRHMEVAGEDGVFYGAQAVISGNTLEVSSARVSRIKTVRHAWHEWVVTNLAGRNGYPVDAFRIAVDSE